MTEILLLKEELEGLHAAKSALATAENDKENCEQELKKLGTLEADLEKRITQQETLIVESEKQLPIEKRDNLKMQIEQLTPRLDQAKLDRDHQAREKNLLDKQIADTEKIFEAYAKQESDLQHLHSRLDTARTEIASVASLLTLRKSELQQAASNGAVITPAIASLKTEVQVKETRLVDLNAEETNLKKQITGLEAKVNLDKKQLPHQKRADLLRRQSDLIPRLTGAEARFQELDKQKKALDTQLGEVLAVFRKHENLRSEEKNMRQKIKSVREELDSRQSVLPGLTETYLQAQRSFADAHTSTSLVALDELNEIRLLPDRVSRQVVLGLLQKLVATHCLPPEDIADSSDRLRQEKLRQSIDGALSELASALRPSEQAEAESIRDLPEQINRLAEEMTNQSRELDETSAKHAVARKEYKDVLNQGLFDWWDILIFLLILPIIFFVAGFISALLGGLLAVAALGGYYLLKNGSRQQKRADKEIEVKSLDQRIEELTAKKNATEKELTDKRGNFTSAIASRPQLGKYISWSVALPDAA